MLRLLFSLSSSLHMATIGCLDNLFSYKMPMHRKYVRLRCDFHLLYDALIVLQFLSFVWASLNYQCLAKGVKQQRLLGGNPMNLSFFLSVLLRPHHHNSVVIVFFVFLFVFEPSKAFMISLGNGCLIMLEKDRNFLLTR